MQTDIQANRQTGKQAGKQRDRKIDRQTDRQQKGEETDTNKNKKNKEEVKRKKEKKKTPRYSGQAFKQDQTIMDCMLRFIASSKYLGRALLSRPKNPLSRGDCHFQVLYKRVETSHRLYNE